MIECRNCKTPQFLQITQSQMWSNKGEIAELKEEYECTLCGSEGSFRWDSDGPRISGEVGLEKGMPRVSL